MSRIGRKPISLPEGVTLDAKEDNFVMVKGPLGELKVDLPRGIEMKKENGLVKLIIKGPDKNLKALYGTTRALLANAIAGTTAGFEKRLELKGVGFRAEAEGDTLHLSLGFSHKVDLKAPEGINFSVEKNVVKISGIDKQKVGEVAAKIRKIRPPEPYKGKGVRYLGEVIVLKPGKAAKTVGGAK